MTKRPALIVNHENLRNNMKTVVGWCRDAGIDVAGVIKVTTGLASAALDYESAGAKWIASSRLEQLVRAKEAGVKVPLLLIRIPMLSELDDMVQICDYSLQSEFTTLKAADEAAAVVELGQTVNGNLGSTGHHCGFIHQYDNGTAQYRIHRKEILQDAGCSQAEGELLR